MKALTKPEFRSRILKGQERRKIGRREATSHSQDNWYKTRETAWMSRHTSQSAY